MITSKEKQLANSPIYYYISGEQNKESILFVHAAFADHTQYNKQAEYFSADYKVITLDLIGHGKSIDTKTGDSIEKTAEYINQILAIEHIEKAHFAGVSIGAVLIQDFANKYPEKVASLSCFGGYDINNFDSSIQKENSKAQMGMMLKAVFSIKWFAESNKLISAYTPEAQELFYQMNIGFRKKSFIHLSTLGNLINKHIKGTRNYPLMIGCGDKDIPMELEAVNMWHESEPNSILVIFENSGHLVNMDVPDEFNRKLEQFIKQYDPKK